MEENLNSMSMDYHNLLINGQAFSDVTFSVEGRLVHAHRCILAARCLFFRQFFFEPSDTPQFLLDPPNPRSTRTVITVSSVGYEVFLLLLQFLYTGRVSIHPQKHGNCGDRGCSNTHCTAAVDLALDLLAAARSFGVDQLALLTQKQLENMVLLPIPTPPQHLLLRMCRALDTSDLQLVKLMLLTEPLDLDRSLAIHYAVQHCSRDVVKSLLELGSADVNFRSSPSGRTPLHIAAQLVRADMVAVLLDHHADPNARTIDGLTPLDILRGITSNFLFNNGGLPGIDDHNYVEPNKVRLCLELLQSAVMVSAREDSRITFFS